MRVLISAGTLGGPGGAQRALQSMIRALDGDDVTVVARKRSGDPIDGEGTRFRVYDRQNWRWRGSSSTVGLNGLLAKVLNPLRRRLLHPRYDVYLRLFQGGELSDTVRARVRLLIPSGSEVTADTARPFDFIAMQAPDNVRFAPAGQATTLLPPPLYPLAATAEPPPTTLPERFLLTVFNPYGTIKGGDDLARCLDDLPAPIVWCHSAQTLAVEIDPRLAADPRVVHVESPTPEQLRYLYERSVAYVCFSKTEGFGWSIADALRYSPAVVSRDIGVLTYPEAAELPGVVRVDDSWQVPWQQVLAAHSAIGSVDWLGPERFRERLRTLASEE